MKVELKLWVNPEWQDGVRSILRRVARARGWDLALTFCATGEFEGPGFEILEPDSSRDTPIIWELRQIIVTAYAEEVSKARGREVHARSW